MVISFLVRLAERERDRGKSEREMANAAWRAAQRAVYVSA